MKKFLSIVLILSIMLTFNSCVAFGKDGKDGKDGVTPTIEISDDGYWIINGVKTEYKAIGTDGKDGVDGKDGIDSITPTIEISDDGYWIINGVKTEHKAIGIDGKDGVNGTNGKDGVTPTIEISDDGYWVINGEKSNIKATPQEAVCENAQELSFYRQDDGTYLVASGTSKNLSEIVIPDTYKGEAVVGIYEKAFQPLKISSSSYTAYEKSYLKSIVIPSSITTIGNNAFYYCSSLTTIEFEGTVEQWNAIRKVGNWNYGVPATEVICSDGTVSLN